MFLSSGKSPCWPPAPTFSSAAQTRSLPSRAPHTRTRAAAFTLVGSLESQECD